MKTRKMKNPRNMLRTPIKLKKICNGMKIGLKTFLSHKFAVEGTEMLKILSLNHKHGIYKLQGLNVQKNRLGTFCT
jgi:hypothetical protein